MNTMTWAQNPLLKGLDAFQRVRWIKQLANKKELDHIEIDALQEILSRDPYPEARAMSGEILKLHQLEIARETLENALLEDDFFEVRLIAAEALGQFLKEDSITVLKEALLEEDHVLVRKAIIQALQGFGEFERDVAFFEKALEKEDDPLIGEIYADILETLLPHRKVPSFKAIRRIGYRLGYLEETPKELVNRFMDIASVIEADGKNGIGEKKSID